MSFFAGFADEIIKLAFKVPSMGDAHEFERSGYVYDVFKLWDLVKDLPIHDFDLEGPEASEYMESTNWTGGRTPTQILGSKDNEHGHLDRIRASDLKYPILLAPDKGVADGMHRLAKAVSEKRKSIKARKLTWKAMEPALVRKPNS